MLKKRILFLVLSLGILVPFSSAMKQQNAAHAITQKTIEDHFDKFFRQAMSDRGWMKNRSDTTIQLGASWWGGYSSPLAQECVLLIRPLFREPDAVVKEFFERIKYSVDIDSMNTVIERYKNEKPINKNSFARILHEETVKRVPLPDNINKEELMRDPKKYRKLYEEGKINKVQFYESNVKGYFVKYYLEEVAKIL